MKTIAALLGHSDIRTDIADDKGITPLQIAIDAKNDTLVEALESKGKNLQM